MKRKVLLIFALLALLCLLLSGCSKGADSYQDKYASVTEKPAEAAEESSGGLEIRQDSYGPPSSVIEVEGSGIIGY